MHVETRNCFGAALRWTKVQRCFDDRVVFPRFRACDDDMFDLCTKVRIYEIHRSKK